MFVGLLATTIGVAGARPGEYAGLGREYIGLDVEYAGLGVEYIGLDVEYMAGVGGNSGNVLPELVSISSPTSSTSIL